MKHYTFYAALYAALWACFLATPALAEAPRVVATIKPVHALVAGVMNGVAEPMLLVDGNASPHLFQLTPAKAKALAEADVVFAIGGGMEPFLQGRTHVAMIDAPGMQVLPVREVEPEEEAHGEHGHAHGPRDVHIWLHPANALVMVEVIAEALAQKDPAHAVRYQANAKAMHAEIAALHDALLKRAEPLKNMRVATFHNAYQYFEQAYGLLPSYAFTHNPQHSLGARHMAELMEQLRQQHIHCLLYEPGFERPVRVLAERNKVAVSMLDPEGTQISPGSAFYTTLMESMMQGLERCQKP